MDTKIDLICKKEFDKKTNSEITTRSIVNVQIPKKITICPDCQRYMSLFGDINKMWILQCPQCGLGFDFTFEIKEDEQEIT